MQTQRLAVRAAFMAMAIFATSCATKQDAGETDRQPVDSYDGLLTALRGNGSKVEYLDSISQPFFVPEGQVISVDGSEVQVFEFSNEEDALSAAETISPDGSSIGTSMISWVEAPHFYKSGKLIVLYAGEEDTVVEVLAAVLGPQFAGAESVEGPSMETEPPVALLQVGGEEQISGIGSYCWTDPNAGIALCSDKVGLPTSPEPIVVDGPVVVRFINPLTTPPDFLALSTIPVVTEDKMSTEIGGMSWWPPNPTDQFELPLKSPHEIELSLDPGLYVLNVFAQWQEIGDVSYGFLVEVTPSQGSEEKGDAAPADSAAAATAVEPLQIDGVWVFQHEPEVAMDALQSGTPEIVDGCLVIDDTIVVWPVDRIEEAAAAIAAAKAGESPQLFIAGGGLSIDEGADASQIPSIISDRCPTRAVWYSAP